MNMFMVSVMKLIHQVCKIYVCYAMCTLKRQTPAHDSFVLAAVYFLGNLTEFRCWNSVQTFGLCDNGTWVLDDCTSSELAINIKIIRYRHTKQLL